MFARFLQFFRRYRYWLMVGVPIILIGAVMAVWFAGGSSTTTSGGSYSGSIGTLMLLGLILLGIMLSGHGNWVVSVALFIVCALAAGFWFHDLNWQNTYGKHAEAVLTANQEKATRDALAITATPPQSQEVRLFEPITIDGSKDWSKPIRVPGGLCVFIYGKKPEDAQRQEKAGAPWLGWNEYGQKIAKGEVDGPEFVRVRSDVEFRVEYRRQGQC